MGSTWLCLSILFNVREPYYGGKDSYFFLSFQKNAE